ncbi:Z1 domain-containing protein [Sphaerochaeta halotolerans]|jgi:hypothetical protein|uniref:Z1 domain-containing protein n=1 Tax=Sphaerochaeta halotolerans TaxID=2293840 RepID=UPI001367D7BC|nr:Z1 domain-containing protein [Sphaerochaeta halotolerans]
MNKNYDELYRKLAVAHATLIKQNQLLSHDECKTQLKEKMYELDSSLDESYIHEVVEEAFLPYTVQKISSEAAVVPKNIYPWVLEEEFTEKKSATYWNAYALNLKKYMHLTDEQITELRDDCLVITNRLVSPRSEYIKSKSDQFNKKGLVYGNVQSGKTATFGGVIAQYVSKGCRIVIVLSGTLNNLREQTLNRLRRDLGIDHPPISNMHWHLITDPDDLLRKNCQKIDSVLSNQDTVLFGVFKKNSQVLKHLNNRFLKLNNQSFLSNYQALIIDDECDQASINVANISADERSAINKQIIQLFKYLPRYSYIGFTATPYANVLNEPPGEYSLYPSDFIVALPEKQDYYGASKIFGLGEEFEDYDTGLPTLDIINPYNKNGKRKDEVFSSIELQLLENAIRYFLLATACKYERAESIPNSESLLSHSTMMIHCSHKIIDQREILSKVKAIYKNIVDEYNQVDNELSKGYFKAVWDKEYVARAENNRVAIKEQFPEDTLKRLPEPSFNRLFGLLATIIEKTELKIDNGEASDHERLVYDDENPAVYIATGGNTLSRGLTLEGLVVSFFSRSTKTYDSLMQMGRWFGYRRGYEDLPRLWMPYEVMINFRFLAGLDIDLRESIKRYELDASPRQVALAIRTNPHMQIVRKMAMQNAVQASVNLAGHRPQTIYFRKDTYWLHDNIEAAKNLVRSSVKKNIVTHKPIKQIRSNYLFEDINFEDLTQFLEEYQFHMSSVGLSKDLLLGFISKAKENGYLDSWNLVLKSVSNTNKVIKCELFKDFLDIPINYLIRGQIDDIPGRVNLKAITSPGDILCDTEIHNPARFSYKEQFEQRDYYFKEKGKKTPGLVILYPIYSKSKSSSKDRLPLTLDKDIIGVAFVFPMIAQNTGLYDSVVVNLPDYNPVDEDYDDLN